MNKNSGIFPGRDNEGKYTGSWGLANPNEVSASDHFRRAQEFGIGGAGYKREALLNSMGLITKNQRKQKGIGAFLQNKIAIPAYGLYSIYDMAFNPDGFASTTTNIGFGTGSAIGFRTGQSLGMGIARTVGMRAGIGGAIGGGLGGGILGVGLAVAGYAAGASFQSNNGVNSMADSLRSTNLFNKFTSTDLTLTNRQRALNKISKSALNNRGQILGNEASVLNGML